MNDRKTGHNAGFASGGLTSLVNINERALCFYSSVVLADSARAGCSEIPHERQSWERRAKE